MTTPLIRDGRPVVIEPFDNDVDISGLGNGIEQPPTETGERQEMSSWREVQEFHLQGQHDQKTHGRRFKRAKGLSEPDSGFTLDAVQLRPITTGFSVAVAATDRLMLADDAFDDDGNADPRFARLLRDRIDAAQTAEAPDGTRLAVGGWHNPADGKVEVNVSIVFPKTERERALQFAVENDQIAMADLDAIAREDWDNAIISTGGTGGDRDTED